MVDPQQALGLCLGLGLGQYVALIGFLSIGGCKAIRLDVNGFMSTDGILLNMYTDGIIRYGCLDVR